MANVEHVNKLLEGASIWNKWRAENPGVRPDLNGADLAGQVLSECNLSLTGISFANLRWTTLIETNFGGSNLVGTDLTDADLTRTNFDEVTLGKTIFGSNDLSVALELEHARHSSPSIIGIETVYISKGNIPEAFLRGAGVPNDFITYVKSLSMKTFEYYSCFISFTEADDLFSEKLYNDLQAAGVRCWRWKEDAKWGKTLMASIDEAVQRYDKLVVVCSERSLNSPAVIREIERALQKEDDLTQKGKGAEVLFPVRLDDYVLTGWSHHRKSDVTAKNVGDFRRWVEPDQYRKGFERLVIDLEAERTS